jgi:hypothetical protein
MITGGHWEGPEKFDQVARDHVEKFTNCIQKQQEDMNFTCGQAKNFTNVCIFFRSFIFFLHPPLSLNIWTRTHEENFKFVMRCHKLVFIFHKYTSYSSHLSTYHDFGVLFTPFYVKTLPRILHVCFIISSRSNLKWCSCIFFLL